jgi:hypothetical protein
MVTAIDMMLTSEQGNLPQELKSLVTTALHLIRYEVGEGVKRHDGMTQRLFDKLPGDSLTVSQIRTNLLALTQSMLKRKRS